MFHKVYFKVLILFVVLAFAFQASSFFIHHPAEEVTAETSIADVLKLLDDKPPSHIISSTQLMVDRGRELVFDGVTTGPDGRKTAVQSKYYRCVSCHNTKREDPDLRVANPDTRLSYVILNQMRFFQATTLFGTVNKETWYNGDYEKKYKELVKPARHSVRGAIQLCSTECSQGRKLEDWELDAILAYLWTLELKISDLKLSPADLEKLNKAINQKANTTETIKWLKSNYLLASPATFVDPPASKQIGYNLPGDPKRGKMVYILACIGCHKYGGVATNLLLDFEPLTFKLLKKNIEKDSKTSIYNAIRVGSYPLEGHSAYMPNYTAERMSNQQVEDLRAYIEQEAK